MNSKKIVITGTHLTPSLALIDKLTKNSFSLTYLSCPHLTEEKILISKRIPLLTLKAPKLHRHHLTSIFNLPLTLPISIIKAYRKLTNLKPDLIISFGGYVALPVCLAAFLLKIPIIIHEQTFGIGLVNRLTSVLATKIAISWSESQQYFPKSKTVLTGNPIRPELVKLKVQSKTDTIYVTGGNQGSKALNETISEVLPKLLKKYSLVHQFGLSQSDSDWQTQLDLKNVLPDNLARKYTLKKWFDVQSLNSIFSRNNLVISRSGANTITELAFLNKIALLIPLPKSQKNEQLINAQYLKDLGLAIILPQKNLNSKTLLDSIELALKTLPVKATKTVPHLLIKNATSNLYQLVIKVLSDS
jgi:UDP-N-acetylglucosamine--N-acetylmuramyl-(pentapeptide) pyrophosphoryl-undecaprenol N-acetylglucosamine transferase